MAGINKVTPSRVIRPIKSGDKNQTNTKKQDTEPELKDKVTESDTPVKHIDARV
jgi:hypothetical protein